MKKRGVSQIDWTMSLALFLLFIAVTFLLVAPKTTVFIDEKAALSNIKYGFIEDYSYTIEFLPLFIETVRSGTEPIISLVPSSLSSFVLEDDIPFLSYDGEVIFSTNITKNLSRRTLIANPLNVSAAFLPNNLYLRRENESLQVPVQQLYANYNKSILQNVSYLGDTRITLFRIEDDDEEVIGFGNDEITNGSAAIVTKVSNNYFTHKTYLFPGLARIYLRFASDETYQVTYDVQSYTHYYLNPATQGNFSIPVGTCYSFSGGYFDYVEQGQSLLTMITDADLFLICKQDEDTVRTTIYGPKEIQWHFSRDSPGTLYPAHDPLTVFAGVTEVQRGLSLAKLQTLSTRSVNDLRSAYGVSDSIRFELRMDEINFSNRFLYQFATPHVTDNVFITRWPEYVIHENGTRERVLMGVKTWQ